MQDNIRQEYIAKIGNEDIATFFCEYIAKSYPESEISLPQFSISKNIDNDKIRNQSWSEVREQSLDCITCEFEIRKGQRITKALFCFDDYNCKSLERDDYTSMDGDWGVFVYNNTSNKESYIKDFNAEVSEKISELKHRLLGSQPFGNQKLLKKFIRGKKRLEKSKLTSAKISKSRTNELIKEL